MNREIKFKAKIKDNNEWVYGQVVFDKNKIPFIVNEVERYNCDEENDLYAVEWYEVIPETICQYIDETDSHGHKLFWNDEIVVPKLNYRRIVLDNKGVFSIIENLIDNGTDFYYLKNKFDEEVK